MPPRIQARVQRARGGGKTLASKAHACTEDDNSTYTPEEVEFMKAMDRYKRDNRRPFPTWSEVFNVFRSLGYHKKRITHPMPKDEGED
jgi:hypothetical protein